MMPKRYDMNGREICRGDLLRSYHFTGARRKKHYLYHVAVMMEHGFDMVPVSHLDPINRNSGGKCLLSPEMAAFCEIIHGHGPGDTLSFEDRPKFPHLTFKPAHRGGNDGQ
jgi:hypothetical protein